MRHVRQSGFTLIELSIVLIIIGLITGGVLVGRDLIEAAQVRKTLKQFEDFNTAVNVFRNKYNCLPGDCDHATEVGFQYNGNGDGNIGDGYWGGGSEAANFWNHMSVSGLISGTIYPAVDEDNDNGNPGLTGTTGSPRIAINLRPNSGWVIWTETKHADDPADWKQAYPGWDDINTLAIVSTKINAAGIVVGTTEVGDGTIGALTPLIAENMDTKIDDGKAMTGQVRGYGNDNGAFGDGGGDPGYATMTSVAAPGPKSPACMTNTTGDYNIAGTGPTCMLLMKATF